jgi:excisionase family DNA binding protein
MLRSRSKEAMTSLRVSRSTLYRLMESGHLPGYKDGKTRRFSREDLRRCVGRDLPVHSHLITREPFSLLCWLTTLW